MTDERLAQEMERRLAASKGFVELQASGYCHYCETPLDGERKFCDAECAKDWHWERQRLKQNR